MKAIANHFRGPLGAYPNVDGVIGLTHKSGCGLDPREPQQLLRRVLAGIAQHPNISGYVFIGLGCETVQLEALRRDHRLEAPPGSPPPVFLNLQTAGGYRKTVDAAGSLRAGGLVVFEHFIDYEAHPQPPMVRALKPNELRLFFSGLDIEFYEEKEGIGDWGGPGSRLVRMIARKR